MVWNPLPTLPLYEGDELGSINELITYTVPPLGVIDLYSAVVVGEPQTVFTVSADLSGIIVETPKGDLTGVYPLERLTYLDENFNSVNVSLWDDVPAGSIMTAMIPDPRTVIEWTIECTCDWTDELLIPHVEVASYKVIVQQSYDSNQATLKEKIGEQL